MEHRRSESEDEPPLCSRDAPSGRALGIKTNFLAPYLSPVWRYKFFGAILILALTSSALLQLTSKAWARHTSEKLRVWVDTFDHTKAGSFPDGWQGRSDEAQAFYQVIEDQNQPGNRYLKVRNVDSAQFIIREAKVDLVRYPYLNWRWRVRRLPPNADESVKDVCDVAASVNVVLHASRWKPKSIKYSWSTTLAQGTLTESPFAVWPSRCDIVVMRSGEALKGRWVNEKRDVLKDYKRFYGEEEVAQKVIDAIVLMSDSDSTHTVVEADYDSIYFSSH